MDTQARARQRFLGESVRAGGIKRGKKRRNEGPLEKVRSGGRVIEYSTTKEPCRSADSRVCRKSSGML